MNESGDGGGRGARPRTPLGHGGVLGLLVALPLAALTLLGVGRALGPHPAPRPQAATVTAATAAQQATDTSCFGTPPAGIPSRLPQGYRFLWELTSPFGEHGQQATEVYNRSCADPDADYPVLVIRVTGADRPLSSDDTHPGRPVRLSSPQVTGLYYRKFLPPDLRPLLCEGSNYWIPNAKISCRWDSPTMNILLVEGRRESYAILGSRANGIGMHELVSLARRLPGAHAT